MVPYRISPVYDMSRMRAQNGFHFINRVEAKLENGKDSATRFIHRNIIVSQCICSIISSIALAVVSYILAIDLEYRPQARVG